MTEQAKEFDWSGQRAQAWRDGLTQMEAMLAPIDAPLLDLLDLEGAGRIADIACGGGGTTLAIRRRAPRESEVHGVDLSSELIDAAKARLVEGDDVAFSVGNLATAGPPGGPFDRLCSRFGVMFFDDPSAAFANLTRWLAPSGRFAFAVWGSPADNPWRPLHDAVAPYLELPSPVPGAPGPFRYARPETLVALLDAAGFADIAVQSWRGVLPFGGGLAPEPAADFALRNFSIAEPFGRADEKTRTAVRDALIAGLSSHRKDGAVHLDASVHFVTGGRR